MIVDQYGKPVLLSSGELTERIYSKMALKALKRSSAFMKELGPTLFDGRGNQIYLGSTTCGSTVKFRLPFIRGEQATKTEEQK